MGPTSSYFNKYDLTGLVKIQQVSQGESIGCAVLPLVGARGRHLAELYRLFQRFNGNAGRCHIGDAVVDREFKHTVLKTSHYVWLLVLQE